MNVTLLKAEDDTPLQATFSCFQYNPALSFPPFLMPIYWMVNSAAAPSRPLTRSAARAISPNSISLQGGDFPGAASDLWSRQGRLWEKWQWRAVALLCLRPRHTSASKSHLPEVGSPNKGLQRPQLHFLDSSGLHKPSLQNHELELPAFSSVASWKVRGDLVGAQQQTQGESVALLTSETHLYTSKLSPSAAQKQILAFIRSTFFLLWQESKAPWEASR